MKVTKYLAITLFIVAILATAGWFLRNSIIQRISSPILAEYDVELVDVSLDALATRDATIGYLKLVHAKGTTIVIEDLTLPIRTGRDGFKSYVARSVSIVTATRDDEAPFELARLIDQFLSLTDNFAGNEIQIAEFNLTPYPSVSDLKWTVWETEQQLAGVVGSIEMLATSHRVDEMNHDISFAVPRGVIEGTLKRSDQSVTINGRSILTLPDWQSIAKFAGILPDAVVIGSGIGELQFDTKIPFDVSISPSVKATLTPSSPWEIDYINESGETTDVTLREASAIRIEATFPTVEWLLQQPDAALLVTNGDWSDIPLSTSELECQSGPMCTMKVGISWSDANMPIGRAAQVNFSSTAQVTFPVDGVRIDVQPDALLELSKFSTSDNTINRIGARLLSAATMQYVDDGWQLLADSIDAEIESLSLSDSVETTFPLFLEKVTASEHNLVVSAAAGLFAPSLQTAMDGRHVALPGVKGKVSLLDGQIEFDLTTVDLFKDGAIKGWHNLDSGIGAVAIADTAVTFNESALAMRVAPWEFDFDISAGNVAVNLQAKWNPANSAAEFSAQSSINIEDLAGYYTDTAFAGLSSDIDLDYGSNGITIAPTKISVDLIDMGLPIENIAANVALDVNGRAVEVENLTMTAFNGVVNAAPFSFHTGRDVNNVILTAKQIELTELLSIKEFAAISVTGTIGAQLPITIEKDGISISAGKLTGEPPGGVIRYQGGGEPGDADASSIGLVTAALSNFEYESLTSDVSYSKDGDLILQMRLKGRNPDLDDSRPVVLNLGVENNVRQMLKSLQAARAVEEILENRLSK